MLRIKADPKTEDHILQVLNRDETIRIVLIERSGGGEPQLVTSAHRETAHPKTEGDLTLRDHIMNLLVVSDKPLTTREITQHIQKLRRNTHQNTIYNALRLATINGLVKRLPNRTWTRVSGRE